MLADVSYTYVRKWFSTTTTTIIIIITGIHIRMDN